MRPIITEQCVDCPQSRQFTFGSDGKQWELVIGNSVGVLLLLAVVFWRSI
jgi:hypothetical protein